MKKLFALLFIAPFLFSACGDDEEDPKPYFNPVEGEWVYYLSQYDFTETRVFTGNFNASSATIYKDSEPIISNYGRYTINKTEILYKDGDVHNYTINQDTLTLTNPKSGWAENYIKKKY